MRRAAAVGMGLALAVAGTGAPAEASRPTKPDRAVRSSVEITTRFATASGGYVEPSTGQWVVYRPCYTVQVDVVCPAGATGALTYSPVFAMNLGGFNFTCTGAKQQLAFGAGAMNGVNEVGLHRQRPTVNLWVHSSPPSDGGSFPAAPVSSDSENIWVQTVRSS